MKYENSGDEVVDESVKFTSKHEHEKFRPLALRVLTSSRWLGGFPPEVLKRLVDAGRIRKLARGTILSRRGQRIEELTVVLDGTLDVSLTSEAGKRHIQVYLESGQVMNLIPLLDEQPTIHDASAHTDAVLLQIGRSEFLAESERDPRVALALMRILCLRSRVLYASLVEAAFLSLRVRCARVLHSLMTQYGTHREGHTEITLKLSQEDLADMIGRTRQSVNKELKFLEREGVLRMQYSQFIILDEALLTQIALSKGVEHLPERL